MTYLCGHSAPYSGTLPISGMTRRGRLYPLPTSVPRTAGLGCSSSPGLLPTPVASTAPPAAWKPGVDWWLQSRAARGLEAVVTGRTPLIPTPLRSDAGPRGGTTGYGLRDRTATLLPTP